MPLMRRVDPAWSIIDNPHDIPIRLMATEQVAVQPAAIRQALEVGRLHDRLGGGVRQMMLTPDLHPGAGIPVGAVVDTVGGLAPGLIGADIGCGMRLLCMDADPGVVRDRVGVVTRRLREVFFEGARDLTLTQDQREALLRDGLLGLLDTAPKGGGWELYDAAQQEHDLDRAHASGSLATETLFSGFEPWVRADGLRDSQLGSVGGGNHFVEVGVVAEVFDGATAYAWGLAPGQLTVLIHTGSLGFGRSVAAAHRGRDPLDPLTGEDADRYLDAMHSAANFAFANRLALGLMAARALRDVVGAAGPPRLVGDAPHNLIWRHGDGFRHRKGATPAPGPDGRGPFAFTGHPVLIPGSMGASSFVLAGTGDEACLESASHGAGRALSRGQAARAEAPELELLHVVGPVDPLRLAASGRRDLVEEQAARLREEAPGAYKPIGPVVDSVVAAGAARTVARLEPLITVKG